MLINPNFTTETFLAIGRANVGQLLVSFQETRGTLQRGLHEQADINTLSAAELAISSAPSNEMQIKLINLNSPKTFM